MRREIVSTGAIVLAATVVVAVARMGSGGDFGAAHAAEASRPTPAPGATEDLPETMHLTLTAPSAAAFASPSDAPADEPQQTSDPATEQAAGTPAPAVATPVAVVAPAPTQATCLAGGWFCYPRLGIAGAIVPYSDCSGKTDVGTQIRSFTCLSDHYLMGHAYTQFGKITSWKVGDTVVAYGQTFTVTGAFVQSACTQPRLPLAALEMQTSLTPYACGDVLVVQAN